MNIEYPVRLNQDITIVDAKNRVVVPMCWKNDLDHVQRQEALGKLIVELLNLSHDLESKEITVDAPKMTVSERMKKYWADRKVREKVPA